MTTQTMPAPQIQDIYPLSPLQQGILFHDLYAPELQIYTLQMCCELRGDLDPGALRGAWEQLVERHTALRTAFVWERKGEPLQVVRRRVEVPWREEDWRPLEAAERERRLRELLRADHRRGFDLARAPLMRFYLLRWADRSYRFVWTYHHLLMDGWSKYQVLQEAFELYFAACQRRPPRLPPTRPFGDYVAWLKGRSGADSESFWRRYLAGFEAPTPLPPGRWRSADAGAGVDRRDLVLDAATTAALRAFAARHRRTLNTLLQAAWGGLLAAYAGTDDVVFGATVSGRPAELDGVETMVGVMINTVPVRLRVDPEQPLADWLGEVQRRFSELRQHELTALVEIRRWSEVPGEEPLFESLLLFENFPIRSGAVGGSGGSDDGDDGGGLEIAGVEGVEATNYPWTLMASATEELYLTLFYDRSRFDQTAVDRTLGHLRALLEQLPAEPARVGDLTPLLVAERHELLHEWNDTARTHPRHELLHHRFEARARRRPEAVAIECGERHLSYGELERRSAALARRLRALGVAAEARVGVLVERSPELVVALLGVLRAGGAYVPLDPGYPPERLSFMLDAGGAGVVVTGGGVPAELTAVGAVATVEVGGEVEDGAAPVAGAGAENLAYVIFTSGSTGRPKGVQICHRTAVNFLRSMERAPGLDADDRFFALTTISFDIAVLEIFLPLSVGARVILHPGAADDAGALRAAVERSAASVLQATPATWRLLLDAGWPGDGRLRALSGGEALPVALARRLRARSAAVVNLYGPTETTVWSALESVGEAGDGGPWASIGRPIDNTAIHLLDRRLAPVPAAAVGELYIGGGGLSRGYLERPALTAERFLPDPASDGPGARMYRTGDLARRLPDGRLEFLGRADQQVKVRGYRIELGEIEAALERHPALARAVAAVVDRGDGDRRLVAYAVPVEAGGMPGVEALREHLGRWLPGYMIPNFFVPLAELPLTANRKVDRRALPEPATGRGQLGRKVEPRTPTERRLAEIWRQLLGVAEVGVEDSFYALGGHSLLATQLVTRIREAFGIDPGLRQLLHQPTVAGQAAALARHRSAAPADTAAAELPTIEPDPAARHQPFPLTAVQEAYWVGRRDSFDLGSVAAHGYSEITMAVDLERLTRALRRLIDRHDMLRAVVLPDGRQQILERVPRFEIEVVDLRGAEPAEVAATVDRIRGRMSHQVRPLDRWPLFEVCATVTEEGRARLHVSRELLLLDAWSMRLLAAELELLLEDPEAELEPLELSFRDCVLAEEKLRDHELYRRSREYWQERLDDLPPAPELPLARSPSTLAEARFVRRAATLPAAPYRRLLRRAADAGVTPSGIFLAAAAEILARWCRRPRFTLNLTIYHRPPLHPQIDRVVGDFTSVVLLPVDLSGGGSLAVRARAMQERLWEVLEHRYLSGVEVMRELARRRGRSSGALMPVVFTATLFDRTEVAETAEAETAEPAELRRREPTDGVSQTPQVWLDFQVSDQDGGVDLNWDAVEEIFPPGMLDDMFDAYLELVRGLAEGAEAWLEERRGWLPAAQRRLRERVNDTAVPPPRGLLHEPFDRQAVDAPDRIAVADPRCALSYGELYRRSNHLGHRLRALGAAPDRLVAVVMEKGWEQAVAVLGVVKSGAAYLPIDAGWPEQRIRSLLELGEVAVAVTQPAVTARLDWPPEVEVVTLGATGDGTAVEPPAPVQGPGELAYVIFTSGSTGRPKGVMIEHRAALNTVVDVDRRFSIGPDDRVLGLSALSFDLSVWDLFGTLAAGATLVLPAPEEQRNPGAWLRSMARWGVTVWSSVPALMQMLVEYADGRDGADFGPLRLVLLSGDWIPIHLPDRIRRRAPAARVVSLGGATEASIWSILYPIEEVDPEWSSIPYGRPMANQRFQVYNPEMEPCPVWVPGQLFIAGNGLARGYWRDPERTAASFFEHPHTGERLYRTGDLGRYLPSGDLEFLGREDLQVKIRGHRIELGEIESALEGHPGVRSAVVAAVGPDRHNRRLVAYAVLDSTADEAAEDRPVAPEAAPAGAEPAGGDDPPATLELATTAAPASAPRPAVPAPGPVPEGALGRLLRCLLRVELDEFPLPKYRYASAGNLYPVQIYLRVLPGRVEGVPGGAYYFHPRDGRLYRLADADDGAPGFHSGAVPAPSAEPAFTLSLVALRSAIEPIYGELWWDFSVLEAGYVSQLLTSEAAACGLALEPALGIEDPALHRLFQLGPDHRLVHTLVGGAAGEPPATGVPGYRVRAGEPLPAPAPLADAGPPAPPPASEVERLSFKLEERGLRRLPAETPSLPLVRSGDGEPFLAPYRRRRSHREYLTGPVDLEALGRLLEPLRERRPDGGEVRGYPSAAGLYPVRIHLHVRDRRVAGLPAGNWSYRPDEHRLVRRSSRRSLPLPLHAEVNRAVAEAAAFTLFLTVDPAAAEDAYGERARQLCLLEAGHVGHLLMSVAPALGLGLCPIGTFRFEAVRALFAAEDEVFLHALVGGAVAVEGLAERPAARGDGRQAVAATAAAERQRVAEELGDYLAERLPRYMLPASYLFLDALPLSANGKVDRAALPAPDEPEPQARTDFAPPESELERLVASLWRELLEVGTVGLYDNFFDLGGNSVQVVQLHARLGRALGREVELTDLFHHTTVDAQAKALGREAAGSAPEPAPAVDLVTERARQHRAAMRRLKERQRPGRRPPRGPGDRPPDGGE